MALGLTGQFLPGELVVLDVVAYDGEAVRCVGGREVEGASAGFEVAAERGLELPVDDGVELTLAPGPYVVEVRAGTRADLGPGGRPLASGCVAMELAAGQQAAATIPLHRADRCGDGTLDLVEQCDDGNRVDGDGCDSSCRTEAAWVHDDRFGNQSEPISQGEGNLAAVCWRSSQSTNYRAPMRWLDRYGEPIGEQIQIDNPARQDCTSVDVRAGAVLMTFLRGSADPRWPYLALWDVTRTLLPLVVVSDYGDLNVVAAFTGTMEGAIVAVRRETVAPRLRHLYLSAFAVEGGEIVMSTAETLVDDTTQDQESPAVAAGDGGLLIAWRASDGKIWARVFDAARDPGPLLSLYEGPGACGPPSVAGIRAGGEYRYAVVFTDGEFNRVVARLVTDGSETSALLRINEADRSSFPSVGALDGDFVVAWGQPGDGGFDVWARVLSAVDGSGDPVFGYLATGDGVTTEPVRVNPATEGVQDQPAVATTTGAGSSTAIVSYRDDQGDGTDIARRVLRVVAPPAR